ncbi:MAG: SRPBCC family protein [Ilumatobacter sp.]|uniref:SRPBCC family protein n=1 Tax=Ilumatobacter sp. TaxID=1967498 RepID=UPI00260EE8F8|nr:SRPBCC family protein [Ilumatobacter sp.]MDJ0769705.1 SRPBCC family protein [Ilumatobacter sp.]
MTRRLELERRYAASPDRVFDAWTDTALLTQWWGCAPDMLWTVHTWDVRVGGQILVSMDIDGTPFEMRGEFEVVDRPNHLRYRWGETETVDVRIEADGDGAHLRLTHDGLPSDEQLGIVDGGWTHAVDLLGERLTTTRTT